MLKKRNLINFKYILLTLSTVSLIFQNADSLICGNGTDLKDKDDSYCGDLVSWTIPASYIKNYATYDAQSLSIYTSLYKKWID